MAKISTYPFPSAPSLSDYVIGTDVNDSLSTKNFLISDILSLAESAGYVPYTGATQDLNLGTFGIYAYNLYMNGGSFYDGNGSPGSLGQILSSQGPALSPVWVDLSTLATDYVPYIGANNDVNLGNYSIYTYGVVLQGGTIVDGNDSEGISGQVLTSQGIGNMPLWQDVSVVAQQIYNVAPVGNSILNVNAYLQYGINVIDTASTSDYALRLPSTPIEGRQVVVINVSGASIVIYPSMAGGSINGVIDGSMTIPSNGLSYVFYCYENPAPGSWSSPNIPLVNSYDSGVITVNVTGPNFFTDVISASDPSRWVQSDSFVAASGWAYNGINQPLYKIQNFTPPFSGNYVAFKPSTPWNMITKVTCYTNMTNNTSQAFGIGVGYMTNYYATGTTSPLLSNGGGGSYTLVAGTLSSVVNGSPVTTPLTLNPGDPGTLWGQYTLPFQIPQVGDVLSQSNVNIVSPPLSNVDAYVTTYINFVFQPRVALSGIKFRFVIDYI